MSTPDPEGMSLLAKVMASAAAVVGPLWGIHKWIDGRLDKKANKDDMKRCLEHIDRLYQNAEQDRAETRSGFERITDKLTERMDENHRHVVGLIIGNRNAP